MTLPDGQGSCSIRGELLSIGAFSAQCGLSPKVLRTYASAGLLVPAAVDRWSGYRYYAPGQVEQARTIGLLRRAGVPLAEIVAFLGDPTPGQVERWERTLDTEVRSRRQSLVDVSPTTRARGRPQEDGLRSDPELWSVLTVETLSAVFADDPSRDGLIRACRGAGRAVWERAEEDPDLHGMSGSVRLPPFPDGSNIL